MQRGESRQLAGDVLLFGGVSLATFLVVFATGFFQSGGAHISPSERLRMLSAVAAGLTRDVGDFRLAPDEEGSSRTASQTLYSVQRGDTLTEIAQRHEVDVAELVEHNGLADPDRIKLGQTLAIPVEAEPAPAPGSRETSQQLFAAVQGLIESLRRSPEAESGVDPAEYAALQELLAMAEEELRAARFDEAEHSAKAAERLLGAQSDSSASGAYRARLEVVRATVQSAFGDMDEAQRSLERALEANPELELDPSSTPRKLVSLLDAIRATRPALGSAPVPGLAQAL
jgi:LysM repeat protein